MFCNILKLKLEIITKHKQQPLIKESVFMSVYCMPNIFLII